MTTTTVIAMTPPDIPLSAAGTGVCGGSGIVVGPSVWIGNGNIVLGTGVAARAQTPAVALNVQTHASPSAQLYCTGLLPYRTTAVALA